MKNGRDVSEKVEKVIEMLQGKQLKGSKEVFKAATDWLQVPGVTENQKRRLTQQICESFNLSEAQVYTLLAGSPNVGRQEITTSREKELWNVLPKDTWLDWYAQYTKGVEAPLSYHIFASLCVVGCALGKRVHMNMHFFKIWPNYPLLLIGPTGKVRKSTAASIAHSLVSDLNICPVIKGKITPEKFVVVLEESPQQLVYASEVAGFFGKQRYNEGMATLLLEMLDCPKEFEAKTITRQPTILRDVVLSFIGCSTKSLLEGSTPAEVTSSGFLNRFVIVCEEETERCFPIPVQGEVKYKRKLEDMLKYLRGVEGYVTLDNVATEYFNDWYNKRAEYVKSVTDEMQLEVMERTHVHLLKTAMLIHITRCDSLVICAKCLEIAWELLSYSQSTLPYILDTVRKGKVSQDGEYIVRQLRKKGGASNHSDLLKSCSNRLDAQGFRRAMGTLKEQGVVREEKKGTLKFYLLE